MTGPAVLLLAAAAAANPAGVVTVETRDVAPAFTAYARVEPIATVTVSAVVAGAVSSFTAVPGSAVRRGETVARITGPEQTAEIEQARTAVARARAALHLAESTAAAVKSTYPDLSTRQELDDAEAAVAEARAVLQAARAALANQRHAATVRAPADGTVLATFAADGDRVAAGSPLLRIQPAGGLWVRGSFYGPAAGAVTVGMEGRFQPADGGAPVPVRVRSVIAPVERDGGRGVGCVAAAGAPLTSGEMGTLVLTGARRAWPAVPTEALVMDGGRWWVLVRDQGSTRRQTVEIGASVEGWTLIRKGLEPGQKVVAAGAYLLFHRDFSKRYQPPD